MTTLHIEHAISDYPTWRRAFDRFEDARAEAGVTSYRVRRPDGDQHYIVVDLEFETPEPAGRFLEFLRRVVWADPAKSPALAGTPTARVLHDI